jgi:guanylate kinase
VHYHFVAVQDFLEKVRKDEFIEWAQSAWQLLWHIEERYRVGLAGWPGCAMLEIDWQGAQQVRRLFPAAIGVFILPPSLDALERRLCERDTDSAATIALSRGRGAR